MFNAAGGAGVGELEVPEFALLLVQLVVVPTGSLAERLVPTGSV